eukprot:tig00020904_g15167.t1
MARERPEKRPRTDSDASSGSISGVASASAAAARLSALECLPDDILLRILSMSVGSTRDDGEWEIEPRLLARLARVSRRFRQLAKDPGVWERVLLDSPNDATAKGLAKLPAKTRAGIRSIALRGSKLADDGFHSLFRAFGGQLKELHVSFNQMAEIPFSALPLLYHFSSLRFLSLRSTNERLRNSAGEFGSPTVQKSLALLASLSLEGLDVMQFPVTPSTLQAFAAGPSKDTLKSLKIGVMPDEELEESCAAALAAVGSLAHLSTLAIQFFDSGCLVQDAYNFIVSEDDLKPLASLTSLRKLRITNSMASLECIRPLASLEEVDVATWGDRYPPLGLDEQMLDYTPLLASAGSLQRLRLGIYFFAGRGNPSIANTISRLTNLKELRLICDSAVLEQHFDEPLKGLSQLCDLALEAEPDSSCTMAPGALFGRLASDVPSLQRLQIVDFMLPFPDAMDCIVSLCRLPQLELSQGAASYLDAEARRFLRAALPLTQITYDGKPDALNDFDSD